MEIPSKSTVMCFLLCLGSHFSHFSPLHRYASQARSIVNAAHVNEDPNVALIRSLRQEIEMLRAQFGDSRSLVCHFLHFQRALKLKMRLKQI